MWSAVVSEICGASSSHPDVQLRSPVLWVENRNLEKYWQCFSPWTQEQLVFKHNLVKSHFESPRVRSDHLTASNSASDPGIHVTSRGFWLLKWISRWDNPSLRSVHSRLWRMLRFWANSMVPHISWWCHSSIKTFSKWSERVLGLLLVGQYRLPVVTVAAIWQEWQSEKKKKRVL